MYLKPDTALLVNNKPFFIPAFTQVIGAIPCFVVRINRMGKNIARRFAERYFSQVTLGLNLVAPEELSVGGVDGAVRGTVFDNSFVVGKFVDYQENYKFSYSYNDNTTVYGVRSTLMSIEGAIELISKYVTLRDGDMIAVDFECDYSVLQKETVLSASIDGAEVFTCKIK